MAIARLHISYSSSSYFLLRTPHSPFPLPPSPIPFLLPPSSSVSRLRPPPPASCLLSYFPSVPCFPLRAAGPISPHPSSSSLIFFRHLAPSPHSSLSALAPRPSPPNAHPRPRPSPPQTLSSLSARHVASSARAPLPRYARLAASGGFVRRRQEGGPALPAHFPRGLRRVCHLCGTGQGRPRIIFRLVAAVERPGPLARLVLGIGPGRFEWPIQT